MKQNNHAINNIWKVLKVYENIYDDSHNATAKDFQTYLLRLCVLYKGAEDKEIYELINGLRLMSIDNELQHDIVRNIVFHCIDIITKRG